MKLDDVAVFVGVALAVVAVAVYTFGHYRGHQAGVRYGFVAGCQSAGGRTVVVLKDGASESEFPQVCRMPEAAR